MKAKLSNYSKPRPIFLMVLGDSLLYASTAITGMSIAADNKLAAYISLGCGIIGYFCSKLFAAIEKEHAIVIEEERKVTNTTTVKQVDIPKKIDEANQQAGH